MRPLRALAGQPIELIVSLTAIGFGARLTMVGAQSTEATRTDLLVAGTVLTAVGGVLLSWIGAKDREPEWVAQP